MSDFKLRLASGLSASLTDPRLQILAASVLRPSDAVVIISSSGGGRIDDLLEVAERAHQRGAAVLAITASHSPLAKKADLAVGVAMRRGAAGPVDLAQPLTSMMRGITPNHGRPLH